MARVGTAISIAHAQDFERRKRSPGEEVPEQSSEDDDYDDDDEEDEEMEEERRRAGREGQREREGKSVGRGKLL